MTENELEKLANGDTFRLWIARELGDMREARGEQTSLMKTVVRQNAEQFRRLESLESQGCQNSQRNAADLTKIKKAVFVIFIILSSIVGADKILDFIP